MSSNFHSDGTLFIVSGPSGAGKTTLTVALARRGWTYFSDNLAPISLEEKVVEAFPKPVTIRGREEWRDWASRWVVPSWLPAPVGSFQAPAAAVGEIGSGGVEARWLRVLSFDPNRPSQVSALSHAEASTHCAEYIGTELDAHVLAALVAWLEGLDCLWIRYQTLEEGLGLVPKTSVGGEY